MSSDPANVSILRPPLPKVAETIKVRTVRCRALKAKYYGPDGKVVRVGQEHDFPLGDANVRAALGHLEIVPGTERMMDTGLRGDGPADRGAGWVNRY